MLTSQCDMIVKLLGQALAHGLVVSDDTLFFADTTYGLGVEDLADALADPGFDDKEVILEMVFFPDRGVRGAVETLIGDSVFKEAHEDRITDELGFRQHSVQLLIPGRDWFPLVPTRELLAHLVKKLYLGRRLDLRVCAALHEFVPPGNEQSARILMRCRGDHLSESSSRFLCSLIEKSGGRRPDFDQLFELSLIVLAERSGELSAEAYFLEQKRVLTDRLKFIREFEKKRNHYAMEYLMMQRYQVPHESEESVLERLELLSIITDDLLHLQPPSTQFVRQQDLGCFSSTRKEDLATVFRRLS